MVFDVWCLEWRVWGFGFLVSGFVFRVSGFERGVSGFRFRDSVSWFVVRVWGWNALFMEGGGRETAPP